MQITPKYNITLPCPGEQGVLKKSLIRWQLNHHTTLVFVKKQ